MNSNVWLMLVWFFCGFSSFTGSDECGEGLFKCTNNTLCIPQRNNCDGIVDCPDGSDEAFCDDVYGSKYYDHLFRKRPVAENDDYDQKCNLTYHGECICRRHDIICHNKNYRKLPEDLPNKIDLLDLQGNYFRVLSKEVLSPVKHIEIETLGLTHCHISELARDSFADISLLRILRLDNNKIELLPSNVFPENNSLSVLILSYNRISRIEENAFAHLEFLNELDLSSNRLCYISKDVLLPLINLEILYLNGNLINSINENMFPDLPLTSLSLDSNLIDKIPPKAFSNLSNLRSLFLSNNRLIRIHNETFNNLGNLQALTLNDNNIVTIEENVFVSTPQLNSLDLRNNKFRKVNKSTIQPLHRLQYIYFDRFEMCLAAPHVRVCEPKGDGISSHEHLLDSLVLRTCVWVMGTIGCAGNIIVLLGRSIYPTSNIVHSLYIGNLAISDFLMGIYLFIIAANDMRYRGVYLLHEFRWRHSSLCYLCGFLSTLSCESSVLILTLVTWDRFMSVTRPLTRRQLSPKTAILTLLFFWFIAGFVSFVPILNVTRNYFGDEFYGNNGVCLSLHIHDPYSTGWEYSAVMFILANSIALSFIIYAYCRMITEIRASGVACRSTLQAQHRDKVAQRFGIIILTDCACWIPIIVVKIIALCGFTVSKDLYAWLAVFILPINSALNPVLYTMTTAMFKKQMSKALNTWLPRKERISEHMNSGYDSSFSLSLGIFPVGSNRSASACKGSLKRTKSKLTSTNSTLV